jgi:hypothetical protein
MFHRGHVSHARNRSDARENSPIVRVYFRALPRERAMGESPQVSMVIHRDRCKPHAGNSKTVDRDDDRVNRPRALSREAENASKFEAGLSPRTVRKLLHPRDSPDSI